MFVNVKQILHLKLSLASIQKKSSSKKPLESMKMIPLYGSASTGQNLGMEMVQTYKNDKSFGYRNVLILHTIQLGENVYECNTIFGLHIFLN